LQVSCMTGNGRFLFANDKDDREVESIRHAYEVAGAGLMQSLKQFRFGQEERMWAAILEYNMKINGARKESFDTIVASGPRGALPHGVASNKKIRTDETVIIDYGAKTGYVSDITRMVYNGNDQQVLDHLKIVSDTIDIVIESIKPGKICGEIYTIGEKLSCQDTGWINILTTGLGIPWV